MIGDESFTCPKCGMTSHNPHDIEQEYCGNCHDWTGQYLQDDHRMITDADDGSYVPILPARLNYEQLTRPGRHRAPPEPPDPPWLAPIEWGIIGVVAVIFILICLVIGRILFMG